MKSFISIALCLALTACASNYHYQSQQDPAAWQGKNIAAVEKQWGTADQTFHMSSGNSYYLYSSPSGQNFYSSISTNFGLLETSDDFPLRGQRGLQCSAIFKTNASGIIIGTSHIGSNCGGQWAPNG